MGDELAPKYIIRRKQQSLDFGHSNGQMQLCRDALMGQSRKKITNNTLSNSGMEYIHNI